MDKHVLALIFIVTRHKTLPDVDAAVFDVYIGSVACVAKCFVFLTVQRLIGESAGDTAKNSSSLATGHGHIRGELSVAGTVDNPNFGAAVNSSLEFIDVGPGSLVDFLSIYIAVRNVGVSPDRPLYNGKVCLFL